MKADKAKVNFNGFGVGAQGLKEYKFTLDLLNEIDPNKIKSVQTGGKVDVFLKKLETGFWSRLVSLFSFVEVNNLAVFFYFEDYTAPETVVA